MIRPVHRGLLQSRLGVLAAKAMSVRGNISYPACNRFCPSCNCLWPAFLVAGGEGSGGEAGQGSAKGGAQAMQGKAGVGRQQCIARAPGAGASGKGKAGVADQVLLDLQQLNGLVGGGTCSQATVTIGTARQHRMHMCSNLEA